MTCTAKNATPLDAYISASGGSGGGDYTLRVNPFNPLTYAVKKRHTPDARLANVALAIAPRSADSVECSSSELCLSLQDAPFCYDMYTSDFHDGTGTTGNLMTGAYTLSDGRKGNLYTGPFPVPTGGAAHDAASTTTTKVPVKTSAAADRTTAAAGPAKTSPASDGSDSAAADLVIGDDPSSTGETGAGTTAAPKATGAGQPAQGPAQTPNAAARGKSLGAAVGGIMLGALLL